MQRPRRPSLRHSAACQASSTGSSPTSTRWRRRGRVGRGRRFACAQLARLGGARLARLGGAQLVRLVRLDTRLDTRLDARLDARLDVRLDARLDARLDEQLRGVEWRCR